MAVLWLPEPGGALVARSVWSSSAGLAAELEGLRVEADEHPAAVVRSRLDEGAEGLTVPFDAVGGDGVLELARRGPAFEQEETLLATLAAELAALAGRLESGAAGKDGNGTLDVAGDALAAVAPDDGAPARVARLAAVASGGDAALVWRLRDDTLELAGSYGPIVADEELARTAQAVVEEQSMVSVEESAAAHVVTLQLGQPVLGALQVRFAPGRAPDEHRPRAACELRCSRRPRASLLRASPRRRLRARAQPGAALRRRRGDLAALAVAHPGDGDRARRAPPRLRPRRGVSDRRGRAHRRGEPRDRRPASGGCGRPP